MTLKNKVDFIISELNNLYPNAQCSLTYSKPYELLIATRLSAQCTDERVNKVTPALFERYTSLEEFAAADFDELCRYIHSCGFFRGKAKSIIEMSEQILKDYNGEVPDTIEELTKLSGIGRKTANLICGDIKNSDNPVIVEKRLKDIIPPEHQTKFCHNLVHHGRAVCMSRKPSCDRCPLSSVCVFFKNSEK